MSELTIRSAVYISMNSLGLSLDLEIRSAYSGGQALIVSNSKLMSGIEETTLNSVYSEQISFVSNGLSKETLGHLELTSLQIFAAEGITSSENTSVQINYTVSLACSSLTEICAFYYPNNIAVMPISGSRLYQKKIDKLDYIFTTSNIFIWHSGRAELLYSYPIDLQAAAVLGNTLLLGRTNGLYSVDADDLLQGSVPSLLLNVSTTPALDSNNIIDIKVDKLEVAICYPTSFDYFKQGLTTSPVNFTGINNFQILNGKLYYSNSSVPTFLDLPETSCSLSGGTPILKREFTKAYTIPDRFLLNENYCVTEAGWLYVLDTGVFKQAVWLTGLTTNAAKNIVFGGVVGDLLYTVGKGSIGDNLELGQGNNGMAYFSTFRLSGIGEDTTAELLDTLAINDYTHVDFPGCGDITEYFDQIAVGNVRIVETVGNEYKFIFYSRPYVEEVYTNTNGSLAAPEGNLHRVSLNFITGAIAHEVEKITNTKSEFPALAWQKQHYMFTSPMGFRNRSNNQAVYSGLEKCSYAADGEIFPSVTGSKRLLSFDDLNYTEDPENLPPVTLYDSKYLNYLEILDVLSIDEYRFMTVERTADNIRYIGMYSIDQDNMRDGNPSFKSIMEPIRVSKALGPISENKYFFAINVYFNPNMPLKYVFVSGLIFEITNSGVTPVHQGCADGRPELDGLICGELINWSAVYFFYEAKLSSLSNTTTFLKGKGIFFIDNNTLYGVYDYDKAVPILSGCLEAMVSEDAEVGRGFATFKHSSGYNLTKALCAERYSLN